MNNDTAPDYQPNAKVLTKEEVDALYADTPIKSAQEKFGAQNADQTLNRLRQRVHDLNNMKGQLQTVEFANNVSRIGITAAGVFITVHPGSQMLIKPVAIGTSLGTVVAGIVNEWMIGGAETELKANITNLTEQIVKDTVQLSGEIKDTVENEHRERRAFQEIDDVLEDVFDQKKTTDADLDEDLDILDRILDIEEKAKQQGKTVSKQNADKKVELTGRVSSLRAQSAALDRKISGFQAQRDSVGRNLQALGQQKQRLAGSTVRVPTSINPFISQTDQRIAQLHHHEAALWNEFAHLHGQLFGNQPFRIERYHVPPPEHPQRAAFIQNRANQNANVMSRALFG